MFPGRSRWGRVAVLACLVASLASIPPTRSDSAPILVEGREIGNNEEASNAAVQLASAAHEVMKALDEAMRAALRSDLSQARQLSEPTTTFLGTLGTALGPIIGAIIGPLLSNIGQNLSAGTGGAPIIITTSGDTSTTNAGGFGPDFGNPNQRPIITAPVVTRPRPPFQNRPPPSRPHGSLSSVLFQAAAQSLQNQLFGQNGFFTQGSFSPDSPRLPPLGGDGFGPNGAFVAAAGANFEPNGDASFEAIEAGGNFNNQNGDPNNPNFGPNNFNSNFNGNGSPMNGGGNGGPPSYTDAQNNYGGQSGSGSNYNNYGSQGGNYAGPNGGYNRPNNYGPSTLPGNYGGNKPNNYGPQSGPSSYGGNKPSNYGPQTSYGNYGGNYGPQSNPNNYVSQPNSNNYGSNNKPTNYGPPTSAGNYGGNRPNSYGPQAGPSNYDSHNKPTYGPQPGPGNYGSYNKPAYGPQPGSSNYKPNNYGPSNYEGNKPNNYGKPAYGGNPNYGNRPNNYGPPNRNVRVGGRPNNYGIQSGPNNYGSPSGPTNYGGQQGPTEYPASGSNTSDYPPGYSFPTAPAAVIPAKPTLPSYHRLQDGEQLDDEVVAADGGRKEYVKLDRPTAGIASKIKEVIAQPKRTLVKNSVA